MKLKTSTSKPPTRFSNPKKANRLVLVTTAPLLVPLISHVVLASGPRRVSAAEALPTTFWMLLTPPTAPDRIRDAASVARLIFTGPARAE